MSFRKISDGSFGVKECLCPEHNPPSQIYLEPGTYEWTCPVCGQKKTITIAQQSMLRGDMK